MRALRAWRRGDRAAGWRGWAALRRASLLGGGLLLGACAPAEGTEGDTGDACDGDGDGYPVDGAQPDGGRCIAPDGRVDCDDADEDVHPEAPENCNGIDDDCSGAVDDGVDGDHDGTPICADCNDADATIHPGAEELCDALDNDCSGFVDEPFDADGDGYSPCDGDCDDTDPRRAGGLPEQCNGYDDDCDGAIDEGYDQDGDGWLTCRGDCDDNNPSVYWSAVEACDAIDDDCDGAVDELPECWACSDVGWRVCLTPAPWSDALAACTAFGRTLVVPDASTHDALVATALGALPAWIGVTDDGHEGKWTDPAGVPLAWTSWAAGQPDDAGGEDCGALGADGGWSDLDCHEALPFLCTP